ncbi:SDR family oxidoreductase [Lachnospiraceae bacterium AM23-2LB]|nr:SDR family oxidoreductase [Lachnospiraceae bacterium AM23-2LB]RJW05213.1 SDR family oxidoreductase [Lachnospiraceae bacterium AM40-2BH]
MNLKVKQDAKGEEIMSKKMEGRVAIITGGCGGVGIETAKLFSKEGAKILIADMNDEVGEKLVKELNDDGGEAVFYHVDVTKEDEIQACVNQCVDVFGKLDTLINIACIMGVETGYIHETTAEMFDKDVSINFKSVFLFTKYALPELRKNERSTVVNFSAVSAAMGMVGHSIYGASKYAIESFTRMIATQYGKEGVRANCIRPGVMVNPVWADTDFGKEYAAFMLSHLPATRIGTAKDAAPVVLFFASDDSCYVTGQTLTMDGGLTCHEPQWKEDLENFEKGLR